MERFGKRLRGWRKVLRSGLVAKAPPSVQRGIDRFYYYYCKQDYVRREVAVFKRLCRPTQASIDVGASSGLFTLYLSSLSQMVYAFEPVPRMQKYLEERFRGSNVKVFGFALGSEEIEKELRIPKVDGGHLDTRASLAKCFEGEIILGKRVESVTVVKTPVKVLDSLRLNNIGFVKVDVEGFELEVLKGGRETIVTNRPNMFIEVEQRHHREGPMEAVFEFVQRLGYKVYFLEGRTLRPLKEFDKKRMQERVHEKSADYVNNFIMSYDSLL